MKSCCGIYNGGEEKRFKSSPCCWDGTFLTSLFLTLLGASPIWFPRTFSEFHEVPNASWPACRPGRVTGREPVDGGTEERFGWSMYHHGRRRCRMSLERAGQSIIRNVAADSSRFVVGRLLIVSFFVLFRQLVARSVRPRRIYYRKCRRELEMDVSSAG